MLGADGPGRTPGNSRLHKRLRARDAAGQIAVRGTIPLAGDVDRGLPVRQSMAFDIAFGRWLAFCAHPVAAWRLLPVRGRLLLAASYAGVSYVLSLAVLLTS